MNMQARTFSHWLKDELLSLQKRVMLFEQGSATFHRSRDGGPMKDATIEAIGENRARIAELELLLIDD
jgi:hypothetical protein